MADDLKDERKNQQKKELLLSSKFYRQWSRGLYHVSEPNICRIITAFEETHKKHEDKGILVSVFSKTLQDLESGIKKFKMPNWFKTYAQNPDRYAKLSAKLVFLRLFGTEEQFEEFKKGAWDTLMKYSKADSDWLEVMIAETKPPIIPYITPKHLSDFVYELPQPSSTGELKIGLVGDWGTGTKKARALLAEMIRKKVDVVIHLGDVYYCGSPKEVRNKFLRPIRKVVEQEKADNVVFYSIPGNHDYYSGGEGFYDMLRKKKLPNSPQEASFFALKNKDWMVIALDTAVEDTRPSRSITGVNMLEIEKQQYEWLKDKLKEARQNSQGVILISHHQFLTINFHIGKVDGKFSGVNAKLHKQLKDDFDLINAWFWGHEHRFVIFKNHPSSGLKRGRLIGHGAIPVSFGNGTDEYAINKDLEDVEGLKVPEAEPIRVGHDGYIYYCGFAVLTMNGKNCQADYYQQKTQPPKYKKWPAVGDPIFTEQIGKGAEQQFNSTS